jgi:hypothetical protein
MFHKIDRKWINWPAGSVKPGRMVHSALGPTQGLRYHTVDRISHRALLECLPADLQPHARIMWVRMDGPFTINPHRDSGARTVINWYISAGLGITRFYNDSSAEPITHWQGNPVSHGYDPDSLTVAASFRADDDNCYILDTHRIHDVHMSQPTSRQFVSWGFRDLDYGDLLCHFE